MCFVINKIFDLLVLAIARLYRWFISPIIHFLAGPGFGCRFEPSCSEYSAEALRVHGALRGGWLSLRRLSRCQPFGSSGYDPVPAPSSKAGSPGNFLTPTFFGNCACPRAAAERRK